MNGIIALLKPPGMSSSGAVVFLKRILGTKKVGHTGTLDPGAAGVLPICVGRSTRLSDHIMGQPKTYLAEVRFGVETDTLDSYGTLRRQMDCRVKRDQIQEALPAFLGEIWQTPPAYSAVKIDGRKSYELARKGVEVKKPPRKVQIYQLDLLDETGENSFLLRVRCSKGTYIRTLAADLGQALGVPASLAFLLREEAGGFCAQEAYTVDEVQAMAQKGDVSFLLSPERAVTNLPQVEAHPKAQFALEHGLVARHRGPLPEGDFAVYCQGQFYGVAREKDGGIKLAVPLWDLD